MSQDFDPPIIDYARFHGLACDHRQLSPLRGLTPPENLRFSLDDPPELVHIDLSNVKVPEERLAMDAGAASLLSSIAESAKQSPSHSDQDLGIDTHRVRNIKHELPLLRSDHELDILQFAAPIIPDLQNEFLPFETVDIEEDEAFEWPSSYYTLPDEATKRSESEKLEVSKDDLLFLQHTLKPQFESVEHEAFEVDDLPYKRVYDPSDGATRVILIPKREQFQNWHRLPCYHCRPAPNLMCPPMILAGLNFCLTQPVQHDRKLAKLSVWYLLTIVFYHFKSQMTSPHRIQTQCY